MRTDPRLLLRGLAKFVAVVVASGLVGAGLGIALAELSGSDSARPLLSTIDPSERASGVVRFTTSDAVTRRLTVTPRARLRIANRTVAMALTKPNTAEGTTG